MNTTAKHTPGPRRVSCHAEGQPDGTWVGFVVFNRTGVVVARTGAWPTEEEAYADACLIRAAPELLAALARVLPMAEAWAAEHSDRKHSPALAEVTAARALLARVDGGGR